MLRQLLGFPLILRKTRLPLSSIRAQALPLKSPLLIQRFCSFPSHIEPEYGPYFTNVLMTDIHNINGVVPLIKLSAFVYCFLILKSKR